MRKISYWAIVLLLMAGGCASKPVPKYSPDDFIGEWGCYINGKVTPVQIKLLPRQIFESVVKKSFYIETVRGCWVLNGEELLVINGVARSRFKIVSPKEFYQDFPANGQFPEGFRAVYRKKGVKIGCQK